MLNFTKKEMIDAILSYGESIGKKNSYVALMGSGVGLYRMMDTVAVDTFTNCSDVTTPNMNMFREYLREMHSNGGVTFKKED
jgi:3-hydroxyacyl-CoA dehydrogenase